MTSEQLLRIALVDLSLFTAAAAVAWGAWKIRSVAVLLVVPLALAIPPALGLFLFAVTPVDACSPQQDWCFTRVDTHWIGLFVTEYFLAPVAALGLVAGALEKGIGYLVRRHHRNTPPTTPAVAGGW